MNIYLDMQIWSLAKTLIIRCNKFILTFILICCRVVKYKFAEASEEDSKRKHNGCSVCCYCDFDKNFKETLTSINYLHYCLDFSYNLLNFARPAGVLSK